MDAFVQDLRSSLSCEVLDDVLSRALYATDAGNYEITPVAVVVPRAEEDVRAAVKIAAAHGVPIIPRGGGTSLGGQVVGRALVIDFSKRMNRILSIDEAARTVRVEPGIVRDELNAALAPRGLHFAPDPATSSRANVGGMVGNNSSGTRSIVYGKTVDHVRAVRALLACGEEIEFREFSSGEYARRAAPPTREGEILFRFRDALLASKEEIERRFPKVMRRAGGYNLDEFVRTDRWNLAKLLAGSEGTLALSLEIELNLEPLPSGTALCIPHFAAVSDAIRAVASILDHRPSAVELLDGVVIDMARTNRATAPKATFLEGNPGAALIVEFFGESDGDAERKARSLAARLAREGICAVAPVRRDRAGQRAVWDVRKSGLGLVLAAGGGKKPVPFIEDAAIPVEALPEYIDEVLAVCAAQGSRAALYAHASVGVLHVRPFLDLTNRADVERMKVIAERTFRLVRKYGGSWSGEHGDGLVRSAWMERFYGREIYDLFRRVKHLFDPEGLMNPGKIIDAPPFDTALRTGARTAAGRRTDSFYRYGDEGGFDSAIDRCNGVGACRATAGGVMCPSYRATRNEIDSTRGRANALRAAITGRLGDDGMASDDLLRAFDLCLSCKACRSECPVNVDAARWKGEVLQRRHDRCGAPLSAKIVAALPRVAGICSGPLAPLVNAVQETAPARRILERFAGIDARRTLPRFATEKFTARYERTRSGRLAGGKDGRRVALFVDTYMENYDVAVGIAAVELLESFGFEVILARAGCCQRPRISHGFLRDAARQGRKTIGRLDRFIREGIPVLVCEPGCASALIDDLPALIDDGAIGSSVAAGVFFIDAFLAERMREGDLEGPFRSEYGKLLIHAHCHRKALGGAGDMSEILSLVAGLEV